MKAKHIIMGIVMALILALSLGWAFSGTRKHEHLSRQTGAKNVVTAASAESKRP